jgi:restriction endonuclease S subunit
MLNPSAKWPISTCANAMDLASGRPKPTERSSDRSEANIPIYGGNGISGYCGTILTEQPTVVIGRVGEYCGSVHFSPGSAWITDNALWAKEIDHSWIPEFIAAYLQWFDLGRLRARTGQPLVTQSSIAMIPLPCPPIGEQRQIVQILSAVDESIRLAQLELAKWRTVADAAMQDAMSKLTNGEFGSVADLYSIDSGLTLGPYRQSLEHKAAYLRVANVQRASIELKDLATTGVQTAERNRYALSANDLLIVEGHADPNQIGRCAQVPNEAAGLLYQNHLFRLRSPSVDPYFGLAYFNSFAVRCYWRRNSATSSGLYTINSRMLAQMPFPLVSRKRQKVLGRLLRSSDGVIAAASERVGKLRWVKKGLMDDLLTGKVRVDGLDDSRC